MCNAHNTTQHTTQHTTHNTHSTQHCLTVAQVVLFQEYVNESAASVEAKYVFPLDEMSSVYGFEAYINGKHVIGTSYAIEHN